MNVIKPLPTINTLFTEAVIAKNSKTLKGGKKIYILNNSADSKDGTFFGKINISHGFDLQEGRQFEHRVKAGGLLLVLIIVAMWNGSLVLVTWVRVFAVGILERKLKGKVINRMTEKLLRKSD